MTKRSKRKHHAKKHEERAEHKLEKESSLKKEDDALKRSIFQNIKPWHVIVILIVIMAVYILAGNQGATEDTTTDAEGYAKVEFYVMSQCPFGTQVIDEFAPVMEEMGDAIDWQIDYIVSEIAPGQFRSLHGEPEVQGNIVQLCAIKYEPENYVDMLVCQNKNPQAIPGNWESCAEGLDKEAIRTCYEGDEGKELLSESAKRASKAGAQASPTIVIDGKDYGGQRDALSFQRAVCQVVDHEACGDIPACASDMDCIADPGKVALCTNPGEKDAVCEQKDPVEVELIILNDKTCLSCDPAQILGVTKQLFKGVEIREVDVSSEEGKELAEELELTVVPAFIFDHELKDSYGWTRNPRIWSAFQDAGDYVMLSDEATGASHFISEEARIEFYEAIGVTLGDNRPQIDFFVMSYCPYGNQAEEIVEQVFDNIGDAAEFIPRYVIYSNYQGGGPDYCFDDDDKYCSMHGIVELNQNIREMCVNRHLGIQSWFDFAGKMNTACNYKNADTCWEGVADDLGLDKDVINDCFDTEALEMLEEDRRLNKALGVSGSPTIFIDGEKYAGSRDPNAIQASLCSAFDDAPAGCAKALASSASATAAEGGCGA